MDRIIIQECLGFEWDKGNLNKNRDKHNVSHLECEQIFFNDPLLIYDDLTHSKQEVRLYVLGKTDKGRLLFVVFTVRDKLIRIISARDMSKKERAIYEKDAKV